MVFILLFCNVMRSCDGGVVVWFSSLAGISITMEPFHMQCTALSQMKGLLKTRICCAHSEKISSAFQYWLLWSDACSEHSIVKGGEFQDSSSNKIITNKKGCDLYKLLKTSIELVK